MGSTSSKKKEKTTRGKKTNKKGPSVHIPNPKGSDVMISYSHVNTQLMNKVKDCLEKSGLKVWVDVTGLSAGTDFLNKIGQAIIDSKVFICILTEDSIESKYCQDEVSLAYVSDKVIYPFMMSEPSQLFSKMSTGMKLQLSGFEWNIIKEEDSFNNSMNKITERIKSHIDTIINNADQQYDTISHGRSTVNKHIDRFQARISELVGNIYDETSEDFWNKYFPDRSNMPWDRFMSECSKAFEEKLSILFSKPDIEWLFSILRRELCNDDGYVTQDSYTDFCTIDEVRKTFWSRIVEQAVESYTMKEVFNMDSSVRVEAIENLGKYRSPAVIDALLDLMQDPDNNVVTVAAISLARIEITRPDITKALMKCLQSPDRLVRQSACLALGHLKIEKAVSRLVALWRNDFISTVREAAQIALKQIGGTEADKAIQITNILGDEIRSLTYC